MSLLRVIVVGGLVLGMGALGIWAEEPAGPVKPAKADKGELLKEEHAGHGGDKETPAAPSVVKKPVSEVKVSAEARKELDAITEAYKKLTSLEVAGTLSADLNVGGKAQKQQGEFAGSFAAPNKFRHEMKGDVIVGSTGEKLYAFRPAKNDYMTVDAPKGRVSAEEIPDPIRSIVQMQDIGLMCAIVDDAGRLLVDGMREVSKGGDVDLGGTPYAALDLKGDKVDYRVLVDPKTHLVRQVALDMKRTVEAAGRPDVQRATLTFDYTTVSPEAKGAKGADAFAWAAPEGARDVAAAGGAEEGEAMALVGKAAPDFTLAGMDGKPVSMKDLKGSPVILDFWATWCGPCQMSLPTLNKLYKELQGQGLKAYAIDLQEGKDLVRPVKEKLIPDVPVLLDEKGQVAPLYKVNGIPQTVIIGKDGKVRKVFVGVEQESTLRKAIEAAMKE
jgi:peroxiredoxin